MSTNLGGTPLETPPNPSLELFGEEGWEALVDVVRDAVASTQATLDSGHRYCSPGFELARRLKCLPVLEGLDVEEVAEHLERALVEIFEQEGDFPWEEVLGDIDSNGDSVDPFVDFLNCWEKCHGEGVLELAVERAQKAPRSEDHFGQRYAGLKYRGFRRFLAVAEELQLIRGEAPILLPCERLGDLMGTSKQQVSRWRTLAECRKILRAVQKHDHLRGKATGFQFIRVQNETNN